MVFIKKRAIAAYIRFVLPPIKVLDFIFCDIQFEKGMSGIEGEGELRQYCRFFIFFTGHFEDYLLENALLKPDDFLPKPVQLGDIQVLMARLGLRQSLEPTERIIYVMVPPAKEADVHSRKRKTTRQVRPRIPILLNDVIKVEREDKFLHIYGAGPAGKLILLGLLRMALRDFYGQFQKLDIFISPNSSVLINVAYATKIGIHSIVYYQNREVLVTDGYRRKVKDYLERKKI